MGRRKGSINKNVQPVQLDFESNNKDFEEKTEVCMTTETAMDLEVLQQELDLARVELEKTKKEIEDNKQKIADAPKPVETPAIVNQDVSLQEKIAAQKARDSVMVTGKFYNLRVKGQSVKLPYLKYAGEAEKWWPFDHGKIYTIPKGFADQINGGTESDPCYYTPHFIKNDGVILNPDDPESAITAVDTTDKKYSFVPLHFS